MIWGSEEHAYLTLSVQLKMHPAEMFLLDFNGFVSDK